MTTYLGIIITNESIFRNDYHILVYGNVATIHSGLSLSTPYGKVDLIAPFRALHGKPHRDALRLTTNRQR